MDSGWTINPTRRSDRARLQRKTMADDERSEGVDNMATNTTVLAMIDVSINGTLRAELMISIISARYVYQQGLSI